MNNDISSLASEIINETYQIGYRTCFAIGENYVINIGRIHNIAVTLSDAIAFIVVIRQVWGLWKLKRDSSLQDNKGLSESLIQQGVLRFSLSSLLLCEFTLDLRRRNSSDQSVSNIPTTSIQFGQNPVQSIQSAFGRLHEHIITEMGERNDPATIEVPGLEEPDSLRDGSHGVTLDHYDTFGQTQPELCIAE
ncbi:hypothetical protein Clacol_010351 [Clathrus columnatus]|uniref:Uncharacterized protein n=1 Tax=Clathrus columnatus TaxID=1419009 RepID=A0AAV5AQI0_9AGAM|nr:hypothetical protein Clacol_010351 [Clathrus columnatus]